MRVFRYGCLCAILSLATLLAFAPQGRAESLNVTSLPSGAKVEINGTLAGITPFRAEFPGGYFHKTHTVFATRLEHAMILRVSKDGYASQQITITDGPLEWVALNGRHHGNYFVLRSDHFQLQLTPSSEISSETWPGDARTGPIHPRMVTAAVAGDSEAVHGGGSGNVAVASDPVGAEIYVDGKFVGQTPATFHLASGTHRVELKASGKRNWERELEVIKDSQLTLHPVLEQAP
jgi:hypothetical protein